MGVIEISENILAYAPFENLNDINTYRLLSLHHNEGTSTTHVTARSTLLIK